MPENVLDRLKQTCVFIRSPDGTIGSGYLLAKQRIGTAEHVVRSWQKGRSYDIRIGWGANQRVCRAHLLDSDMQSDAAVIALYEVLDVEPLPVAPKPDRDVDWEGYGFPALAGKPDAPAGLPIYGRIEDSSEVNESGRPRMLLQCDQAASGNASPLHGFSGSPVIVGGAVVGHLVRHIGDVDDRRRAAYGYLYACPIDAVIAMLDVVPKRQQSGANPIDGLKYMQAPSGDPDIPELLAWCDRDEILERLDTHLDRNDSPSAGLLCLVGHAEKRPHLLLDRVSTELCDPPRCKRAKTFHILKDYGFESVAQLRKAALEGLGLKFDAQLPGLLKDEGLDTLLLCHYSDCTSWSARQVDTLLRNASAWLDGLSLDARRVVLVLTMRFGANPSVIDKILRRDQRIVPRINKAFAKQMKESGSLSGRTICDPVSLRDYEAEELRKWLALRRVREGLGRTASALDESTIAKWFGGRSLGYGELIRLLDQEHAAKTAALRSIQ